MSLKTPLLKFFRKPGKIFFLFIICLTGLIGFRVVQAAWHPPTDTPPGSNTSPPLNVSSSYQTKQGSLTIGGDFLSISSGNLLISTDDRGIFWGDEANTDLPHIEFANDILYLSAGNAGDSIELQGDVTITEVGGMQGEFIINNSADGKNLILRAETGVNRTEILSDNTPFYINRVDQQDVRLGSGADLVNLCLNDDCITSWDSTWTLNDPNLSPVDSNWNVALGSDDANGYKLQVDGNLNVTNAGNYYHSGTAGITAPCPAGQVLKGVDVSGGIVTSGVCSDDIQGSGGYWMLNGDKLYPNQDIWRVGIGGEPITLSKLYVTNGSVLFDGDVGSVPVEGTGVRMMWVPELGAFRAGQVTSFRPDAWNEANIGNYSFAAGKDTMASGLASFAVGNETTASGEASAAFGNDSTASGDYSFTAGHESLASGYASVAMGGDAEASGNHSAAFGGGIASADYSFAVGNSTAQGIGSAAMGSNTHAISDYSFAGGVNATAEGEGSVAFGHTTAAGNYSFTVGGGQIPDGYTNAEGDYAVALGFANEADGDYSIALGHRAWANHAGSFVFADYWGNPYNTTGENQFRIKASGGVFYGSTQQWDIAEAMDVYKKDNVQPGELVSLSGNDTLEKTKTANDNNLIGVVTSERTNTIHLEVLGQPDNPELERQYITLVGRVYVKVNDSGGSIIVGDPIASSSIPGIGMKADQPSKILGYAMEEADFSQGSQTEVLVFANVGYNNIIEKQQEAIDNLYRQFDELKKAYENSNNSHCNMYSVLKQNRRQ